MIVFWLDLFGVFVFAITGNPAVAVTMGVVTAVVGGIIRDVVCNEIPLVLRQDIYATAAFIGALTAVFMLSFGITETASLASGMVACFAVRASALIWGWSLPRRGEQ